MTPRSTGELSPGFRIYLASRGAATLASAMATVAVTFAVLGLSAVPADLGLVLTVRTLALVIAVPVGGALSDRVNPAVVMMVAFGFAGTCQAWASAALLSGSATISLLLLLEGVNGAATGVGVPALTAALRRLVVNVRDPQRANATVSVVVNTMNALGAGVAGIVVAAWGSGWALAVNGCLYVGAAGGALVLRRALSSPGHGGATEEPVSRTTLGQSLRGARWFLPVVVAFAVLNCIQAGSIGVLGPIVAAGGEGAGERTWGLALAALSVGLLFGGILMRWIRARRPLTVGMLGVASMALFILAACRDDAPPVLWAAAFVAGVGTEVFAVNWMTVLQREFPASVFGRVSAIDATTSFLAIPVGTALYGVLGTVVAPVEALVWSATLYGLIALLTAVIPDVRRVRT